MQNAIPKCRQSSIISKKPGYITSKKPGYLFEKIENFDELELPKSLIFFAETLRMFPTEICLQKGFRDFA